MRSASCSLAGITGKIGGGTLRDLHPRRARSSGSRTTITILGPAPGPALLVYFTAHLVESRYKLLLWLDCRRACPPYSVFGAYKGLLVTGVAARGARHRHADRDVSAASCVTLLADEPSVLLRPEILRSPLHFPARRPLPPQTFAGLPLLGAAS